MIAGKARPPATATARTTWLRSARRKKHPNTIVHPSHTAAAVQRKKYEKTRTTKVPPAIAAFSATRELRVSISARQTNTASTKKSGTATAAGKRGKKGRGTTE